ncbi:MAG: CapA family protein [Chloroflexi bacterium]|nr:CapA family protein [Chloroflexota bacterium]
MEDQFTMAVTGDSILNRRVSNVTDRRFLDLIETIRAADVGYTHLESLIHDYEGPELYPAAQAGGTWMRSPRFVVDELKWAGFDIVSLACNHSLDYSYGGLQATRAALSEGGLAHAGTGRNLGDARAPAYLETPKGRVALISMCSSFTGWAGAGQTRPDVKGRPGLNPLRYYYVVDEQTLEEIKRVFMKLGYWLRQYDRTWLVHPSGLNHAITKFVQGDQPGVTTTVDEEDAEGNLQAIRDARRQADWVLVHLHNHEFDPEKGYSAPARFVPGFSRTCIDAGADVFIGQGSHALLRGIEVYKGKPIFYDPGDFISMSSTVARLPADFYLWPGFSRKVDPFKATPADAYDARTSGAKPVFPPGGDRTATVMGSMVAVCTFGPGRKLFKLELHPLVHSRGSRSQSGIPLLADAEMAQKLVKYLAELSSPFGTSINYHDGLGVVKP